MPDVFNSLLARVVFNRHDCLFELGMNQLAQSRCLRRLILHVLQRAFN